MTTSFLDLFCNLCGVECQNMIKLRKHTKLCLNKDPMKSERERNENSRINNCKTQEVLLTLEKYLEYQKNLELQKLAKMISLKVKMITDNQLKWTRIVDFFINNQLPTYLATLQ